jgi:hypothetical protein
VVDLKATVRACSVLQFHATKALVPICGRGDGGATKTLHLRRHIAL